jgi:hypothetical protein
VFVGVDFTSQEDSFWSGVVIVAFVILLASSYQLLCLFGFDLCATSSWSFYFKHQYHNCEVFSDIWIVVC